MDETRTSRVSYPNYLDLRDRNDVFSGLAAHTFTDVSFSTGRGARSIRGEVVSGNYFSVLGVAAAAGRTLLPEDDRSLRAHSVAVISHGLAIRAFGSVDGAVGKTVYLNGHAFSMVGVAPEWFKGTYDALPAEVWAPLMMYEQVRPTGLAISRRGWGWLRMTGRLRPELSLDQAQTRTSQVASLLEKDYPRLNKGFGVLLRPAGALPGELREGVSDFLGILTVMVGLILLATCANVAGILVTRMLGRRRETAIRQSLGAGRLSLIRQWLAEGVLVSLAGGLLGLLLAVWVLGALLAFRPPVDFLSHISPTLKLDGNMLGFTFLSALLTGVLFGLVPGLRAGRRAVAAALKEDSGLSSSAGPRGSRLQAALVISQVAISLMVLIASGLLVRSVRHAEFFHPGFDTENLLLTGINLRRHGYTEAQGRAFFRRLSERLEGLPGVRGVTLAAVVPLSDSRETRGVRIEGHEPPPGEAVIPIAVNVVGPSYFSTMGISILRGRDFSPEDTGPRPVVIINETMARRYWPGENPVGKYIHEESPVEIIGVARDIKYYSLAEEPRPYMYSPFSQVYFSAMVLHVRAAGDAHGLIGTVREEVKALDPGFALLETTTFAELRRIPLFPATALATLSMVFGLLTLAMSAVGIYGMVSYSVNRRTREIGIRVALGARRPHVVVRVVGSGMVSVGIGVAVGLVSAALATRFLSSFLFGVTSTDPVLFFCFWFLLVAVAFVACYLPARRATRVLPIEVLRYE